MGRTATRIRIGALVAAALLLPLGLAPATPAASTVRLLPGGAAAPVLEFRFSEGDASEVLTAAVGIPAGATPVLEILGVALDPPAAGPAPGSLATISLDGYLGDQRVVVIEARRSLEPESEDGIVRHCRWLRVRVGDARRAAGGPAEEGRVVSPVPAVTGRAPGIGPRPRFEPVLQSTLINYRDLAPVRRALLSAAGGPGPPAAPKTAATATTTAAAIAAGSAGPQVKIGVRQEGIHRVTPADLAGIGLDPAAFDPRRFELTFRGEPVPIHVIGEADGSFDPGDRLLFHGVPPAGFVAAETVYWLREAAAPGLRMATRQVQPGPGVALLADFADAGTAEEDRILVTNNSAADGDYYYWQSLFNSVSPTGADYPIQAPDPSVMGAGATLTATLEGRSSKPHRARLRWNGALAGPEGTWSGLNTFQIVATLPAASLLNGPNTVRVEMINDTGTEPNSIYVNRFRLDYRRLLRAPLGALRFRLDAQADPVEIAGLPEGTVTLIDVSDPLQPIRTEGALVLNEGATFRARFQDAAAVPPLYALATPAGERLPASIVLDAPSALRDPGQGADLVIVSHPDFLDAIAPLAEHRRSRGLRVVVADVTDVYDEFSDGIFDPEAIRSLVQYAATSWTPPAPTYLLLVGDANIDFQDRLGTGVRDFIPPVIFASPVFGLAPEDNHFVAVAGDDDLPDLFVGRLPVKTAAEAQGVVAKILAYEGGAGLQAINSRALLVADNDDANFEGILNSLDLRHLVTTGRTATRVFLDEYPSTTAARDALVGAIDAGAGLVSYMGHGNILNWAAEDLFLVNDVPRLGNTGRYPFVTALNCLNGFYAGPRRPDNEPSLSEALLLAADRGAIAVWAPSALGSLYDYDVMGDELYAQLYRDRSLTLGGAVTVAKVNAVLNRGAAAANLPGMVFLGDPATPLALDSDADGVIDHAEIAAGAGPDDGDSDDDGLADGLEGGPSQDTDGDGASDLIDPDSDEDGVLDGTETGVTQPGVWTDISRGRFRPDSDPATLTDPRHPDTDGGGAADGAEDRNANGRVDAGESDPLIGSDDPICRAAPPPEIDPPGVSGIRLEVDGADLVLRWTDTSATDGCILYRVYVADGVAGPKSDPAAFRLAATTGATTWRHVGAAATSVQHDYLVAGYNLAFGEGPWGHYGR